MSLANPSAESVVNVVARRDLVITESVFQGEKNWVLKDPIALKYFQLKLPEYCVFCALDGTKSYSELRKLVTRECPEMRPTKEDIQNLIISFHRNGLLLVDAQNQAESLRKQRHKEQRQKWIGMLSSIVSIRFPGVDPDRFLSWLYPKVRVFFSFWFTCLAFCLVVSAGMLVLANFSEFYSKLPKFNQFFGLKNLVYMGFVLIFTKSIHELGHGLMCKHFGGECHEIGFMLLVFTPAMYCNTSDSWVLPNKWHRIAIGAAGMYVELFMAAVFTFVWWYTHPNWLHFLALNVMFLSSVSTILFNANPLLRYDGYYILSDWMEVPNLAQKSKTSLLNWLRVACLGMRPIASRFLPDRNQFLFALYSVASFIYRWVVLFLIFWFISEILEPYDMEIIGHLMILISLIGMVGIPMYKLVKFFSFPGRFREVKKKRLIYSSLIVASLLAIFCWFPIQHDVWGGVVILPRDAQHVYVKQAGKISEIKAFPGDLVNEGDVIAILDNSEVTTAIRQLESQLDSLESRMEAYRLSRGKIPDADKMLGQINSEIVKTRRQLAIRAKQKQQLILTADRTGIIISPPNIVETFVEEGEIGGFSGTPFDTENGGAFLMPQTLFCYVGDPSLLKAVTLIEENNAQLIEQGQNAIVLLNQLRYKRIVGTVSQVSSVELTYLPREISKTNGGFIAGEPNIDGTEKPLLRMYEATIEFEPHDLQNQVRPGFFGQSRITVGKASLGWRSYRYVTGLINFR